ncbi:hypothetical protein [Sphaerisporangium fuscum]|uniref:hypothetical protein n=1 Tax=Sphaerisporangium fuscum TaxID=2835868 RepID=UPI001BDCE440|nr:hypothetical protein [Sphaerisporangium fuscum]
MIVLGLLFIVLAGAAVIAVANDQGGAVTAAVTVGDQAFQLSKLELFLAGAATAAVFLIGLMLLTAGMRRAGVRRRKMREARLETRDRVAQLEEEKRRLERKLEAERTAASVPGQRTPPAPSTPVTAPAPTGRHAQVPDRDGDGVDDRAEGRSGAGTEPVRRQETAYPSDQLVAGNRARET